MVASIVIFRAFMIRVNISSQIVQVLGFIRLGRTPNARNGTEITPRIGTGMRICSQHPLQILDCSNSAMVISFPRDRRLPDPTSERWGDQGRHRRLASANLRWRSSPVGPLSLWRARRLHAVRLSPKQARLRRCSKRLGVSWTGQFADQSHDNALKGNFRWSV